MCFCRHRSRWTRAGAGPQAYAGEIQSARHGLLLTREQTLVPGGDSGRVSGMNASTQMSTKIAMPPKVKKMLSPGTERVERVGRGGGEGVGRGTLECVGKRDARMREH